MGSYTRSDIIRSRKFIAGQDKAFIGSSGIKVNPDVDIMLSLKKQEGFEKFYFTSNVPSMTLKQYQNADLDVYIYFYQKNLMRYEWAWLVGAVSSNADGLEFTPNSGIGYERGYQIGSKNFTVTHAVIPITVIDRYRV